MQSVYVVVDCGESYPTAYANFELAMADVKAKYSKVLQWYLEAMGYATFEEALAAGETFRDATDIGLYRKDTKESPDGVTEFYIEKDIHIKILRLPIKNDETR